MTVQQILHDNGRFFGLLRSFEQAEDCQIATIGDCRVILPPELDLSSHQGHRIGIACIAGQCYVRRSE